METPLLTWVCITAAVMIVFIADAVIALTHRHKNLRHSHLIEVSKEQELFFIPGDPMPGSAKDYECDDIENS